MLPYLSASAVLAVLLSFDKTVISLFLSGPRASTLPVEIVRYVEGRIDPLIAALSVLVMTGTLAIILFVDRMTGLAKVAGW
jgi:putative spermidine/putrescine transport system permease protein